MRPAGITYGLQPAGIWTVCVGSASTVQSPGVRAVRAALRGATECPCAIADLRGFGGGRGCVTLTLQDRFSGRFARPMLVTRPRWLATSHSKTRESTPQIPRWKRQVNPSRPESRQPPSHGLNSELHVWRRQFACLDPHANRLAAHSAAHVAQFTTPDDHIFCMTDGRIGASCTANRDRSCVAGIRRRTRAC